MHRLFYSLKPYIPRRAQLALRRTAIRWKKPQCSDIWPIDRSTGTPPDGWRGWPNNKKFALVLTHDVETAVGQDKCLEFVKIEQEFGFRSSFYFVPKRYQVSSDLRQYLVSNGFEVGVHGLYHDGKLFSSRQVFQERVVQINQYVEEWKAAGFRSPAMHYNLEWMHDLQVEYDSSTLDTAPFEPQPQGIGTIFPFFVSGTSSQRGYVEIPCTLPEDFTLFVLLKERSIDTWKQKLDWIVENGGMALLITHPDYINFNGHHLQLEQYPVEHYKEFLRYVQSKYEGLYWHALPKEVARFCSENVCSPLLAHYS